MSVKKIFIILLALVMALSLCACKSRKEEQAEKRKGARENVVISENPVNEENRLTQSSQESSEETSSEPEKDAVPEETADAFLNAVKGGVRENILAYADYNVLFNLAEGQNADWLLRQVLLRLNYEIISSNVEESKASVIAKVSNLDMSIVLPLYFEQAMAVSYENASERLGKTQEELDAEYRKIFVDLLTKYETSRIDRLMEIQLEKKDDKWQIITSSELGNAVLGGFLETQERLRGDMQGGGAETASSEDDAVDAFEEEYEDIDSGFDDEG